MLFLHLDIQFDSAPFIEKTIPSPLPYSISITVNQLTVNMGLRFWTLLVKSELFFLTSAILRYHCNLLIGLDNWACQLCSWSSS